jgi:hypothetical protein
MESEPDAGSAPSRMSLPKPNHFPKFESKLLDILTPEEQRLLAEAKANPSSSASPRDRASKSLKELVEAATGVPVKDQKLVFNQRGPLDDQPPAGRGGHRARRAAPAHCEDRLAPAQGGRHPGQQPQRRRRRGSGRPRLEQLLGHRVLRKGLGEVRRRRLLDLRTGRGPEAQHADHAGRRPRPAGGIGKISVEGGEHETSPARWTPQDAEDLRPPRLRWASPSRHCAPRAGGRRRPRTAERAPGGGAPLATTLKSAAEFVAALKLKEFSFLCKPR